jgi:hypothetical protein
VEQPRQAFLYTRNPKWCLGYVKGRMKAYCQGNLGLGHVAGAIRLARACKVPVDQIISAARTVGLEYDPNTETLTAR